ncbi:MAG: transporter substrate-binding domain-containing protein [Clostridia bacterium]|nr:transporter substrate-binding domain-containing protein [Clostridia bacterium]
MKKFLSLALAVLMLFGCVAMLASCGDDAKVKIIDIKLTDEEYAYLIKKGNTELQSDFNAFLAEIKENGEFQKIVDKYFKGEGTKVGVTAGDLNAANNDDTFIVVTNCPFEPFEYVGNDGKLYGIDIEIAKAYADSRELNLVIKNLPQFDPIFDQVEAGLADIGMAGITISEDRLASFDFTTAYYNASQKIIVPADCKDFDDCKTAADVENILKGLKDKSIGYQTGTTGNWYVAGDADWGYDGFSNVKAKGYDTALDAINDMLNGNIYAVVVDEAPGTAMVKGVNGN